MTVQAWIGGVRFEGELDDFDAFAADAPELFKKVKEIEQAALVVGVLTKAPANPMNTGNPSNTASEGPPPKCTHGVMKDLKEKNYKHRYYCSSQDRSNQCQAKD